MAHNMLLDGALFTAFRTRVPTTNTAKRVCLPDQQNISCNALGRFEAAFEKLARRFL